MQKAIIFTLTLLFALWLTACKDNPARYGKIVNVESAIEATRDKNSTKRAMILRSNDTVQIIDYDEDFAKVRMGINEGFISTENLEIIQDQEVVERIHSERNAIYVIFRLWLERNTINILAVLALLTIVFIVLRKKEPSFGKLMIQLVVYILLISVGSHLISSGHQSYDNQLDLSFGDDEFGSHLFNVLKFTFYFITIIYGYLDTGNALLYSAGNKNFKKRKKGIGLYLWMPVLLVIAIWPMREYGFSIPFFIILALILWNIINNCRAVWPKIHYPIIVSILGCAASVALFAAIWHIFSQLLLLILFIGIIFSVISDPFGFLGALLSSSDGESTSRSSSSSDVAYDQPDYDPYDKVIKGGSALGGDLKAKSNSDGSLTDENGGHWDNDGYGNYSKRY